MCVCVKWGCVCVCVCVFYGIESSSENIIIVGSICVCGALYVESIDIQLLRLSNCRFPFTIGYPYRHTRTYNLPRLSKHNYIRIFIDQHTCY